MDTTIAATAVTGYGQGHARGGLGIVHALLAGAIVALAMPMATATLIGNYWKLVFHIFAILKKSFRNIFGVTLPFGVFAFLGGTIFEKKHVWYRFVAFWSEPGTGSARIGFLAKKLCRIDKFSAQTAVWEAISWPKLF